ncbi:MAG: putative metal-binding motif-containing protein [Myxococcota bacterium]|nr:putative metal-binding motif-containing protein [Myxococcota bacterium]
MRLLLPLLCLPTGCKLFTDPSIPETCEDLGTCDGDGDTDARPLDGDGDGYTVSDGDCDDGDPAIHPGAVETCDPDRTDENCNGLADDEDPDVTGTTSMYADLDGDGWGDVDEGDACRPEDGQVARPGDCDDTDGAVNPGAIEVCNNGKDDDCDGSPGTCLPYAGDMLRDEANPGVIQNASDIYFGLWNAAGDLTDDGTDDLVSSSPFTDDADGLVMVYSGLEAGVTIEATDAAATLRGSPDSSVGVGVIVADVNGDGASDLLAQDLNDSTHVLLGPLAGNLTLQNASTRIDGIGSATFTTGIAVASDSGALIFGDPYGGNATDPGALYVLNTPLDPGSVEGPTAAGARVFGDGGAIPGFVLITGDFDADGVDDTVTSDPYADTTSEQGGLVWVLRDGPPDGDSLVSDISDGVAGTLALGKVGLSMAAGDLDGDGSDDLVLGAPGDGTPEGGRVFVFAGAPTGIRIANAARTIVAQPELDTYFGYSLTVGDVSGDGMADLGISEPRAEDGRGALHLAYGPLGSGTRSPDALDATSRGSTADMIYGVGLRAAGDFDADGSLDLVVSGYTDSIDILFGGGW